MTSSETNSGTEDRSAKLPLLDNGKGHSSLKPPSTRKRSWLVQVLTVFAVLIVGAIVGMYFQGPALRAVFEWTSLEPGAGARQPIALPVDRVPSAQRVAEMATGDVVALGRLQPKAGIVSVALPQGPAMRASTRFS